MISLANIAVQFSMQTPTHIDDINFDMWNVGNIKRNACNTVKLQRFDPLRDIIQHIFCKHTACGAVFLRKIESEMTFIWDLSKKNT